MIELTQERIDSFNKMAENSRQLEKVDLLLKWYNSEKTLIEITTVESTMRRTEEERVLIYRTQRFVRSLGMTQDSLELFKMLANL